MLQQHLKLYWQNFTKQPKRIQQLTAVLVVLIVATIGTFLLIGSHAAAPYNTTSADQGDLTGSANTTSCTSSSDSTCVVFGGSGSSGPTYYVSESGGTTTQNGTSCNDAYPVGFFNNTTGNNWTTTADSTTQIGPGDTVALCGTISTTLTAQGSGASGNPITIVFEPGAILSQPVCPSNTGCLDISNVNYIIVNGENTGTIENTNDGTDLGSQANSVLVQMQDCNNCEIENTTIANGYVIAPGDQGQATQSVGVNGIDLENGNNDTLTGNTMYMDHWAIVASANISGDLANLTISHNSLHDNDHDIITGTGLPNGGTSGPWFIYNNHMYDWSSWDTGAADYYHHDGIHCWGATNANPPTINGMYIYNNVFNGNFGINMNTPVYIEGTTGPICASPTSPVYLFNNVFDDADGFGTPANGLAGLYSGKPFVYNNTFIGPGPGSNTSDYATNSAAGISDFRNNLVQAGNSEVSVQSPASFASTTGYNLYSEGTTGGNEGWGCYGTDYAWSASGFSSWQSCIGADQNSIFLSSGNADLNSDGSLRPLSPAINAGANLSTLCTGYLVPLCSDINGNARPTSGPWDIGAYQGSSGSNAIPPNVAIGIAPPNNPNTVTGIATITANVSVNTSGATIHDVQFEVNGSDVPNCDPTNPSSGSDTNGTYSCTTWNTAGLTCNTTYSAEAIATDSNGLSDEAMVGVKVNPDC